MTTVLQELFQLNEMDENYSSCMKDQLNSIFQNESLGLITDEFYIDEIIEDIESISKREDINVDFTDELQTLNSIDEHQYFIGGKKTAKELTEMGNRLVDGPWDAKLIKGSTLHRYVAEIKRYVKLLNINTTTFDDWLESKEGHRAYKEASEICNEPSDPYQQAGMRRSDF